MHKAKFIGKDGSMGFVNGRVYSIEICTFDGMIWVKWGCVICPYTSLKTLTQNWESV